VAVYLSVYLAVLAIARQPQASNVFAILGVPTIIFMMPILDTTLVTITRIIRGQSPSQGGRDHTSHDWLLLDYPKGKRWWFYMA
jgi:UDP-GlcNAc:undecaprenyl-phosphate GlcNAc-1-phosphate transferase